MVVVLFATFGQCCRTCSCVSSSFAQNLQAGFVSLALLKFALAASIDDLVFIMALHCFLVSLSMYSGLFPTSMLAFLSFQCLTLVLFWDSFSMSSRIFVLISSWIRRFRLFLFVIETMSFSWSSSAVFSTFSFHMLCVVLVASFIRDSSFISSILFACRICFFFIIYSIGRLPVSLRRIVVGVPWGR